jgi:hypothetical protein
MEEPVTSSTDLPQTSARSGWLTAGELEAVRAHLPVVYVEVVPVRLDGMGRVVSVGLLLAPTPDGSISRTLVSGRILHGERVREAILRHVSKDLGPMALPQLPVDPAPFTVAEYFPDPSVSGFHDPRQHAVALVFVVPIDGQTRPSQAALDLAWVSPEEAVSPAVVQEMSGGRDRLVRMALAHAGVLP